MVSNQTETFPSYSSSQWWYWSLFLLRLLSAVNGSFVVHFFNYSIWSLPSLTSFTYEHKYMVVYRVWHDQLGKNWVRSECTKSVITPWQQYMGEGWWWNTAHDIFRTFSNKKRERVVCLPEWICYPCKIQRKPMHTKPYSLCLTIGGKKKNQPPFFFLNVIRNII